MPTVAQLTSITIDAADYRAGTRHALARLGARLPRAALSRARALATRRFAADLDASTGADVTGVVRTAHTAVADAVFGSVGGATREQQRGEV